jgi:hypothetical protein
MLTKNTDILRLAIPPHINPDEWETEPEWVPLDQNLQVVPLEDSSAWGLRWKTPLRSTREWAALVERNSVFVAQSNGDTLSLVIRPLPATEPTGMRLALALLVALGAVVS